MVENVTVEKVCFLGFDPGYVNLGWSLKCNKMFRTGLKILEGRRTERLVQVKDHVNYMMRDLPKHTPTVVGIERLPVGKMSIIVMLESVISILEMSCTLHGAEVYTMSPRCHKGHILGDKVTKENYPSRYNELVKERIPVLYRALATQHSLDASGVLFTLEDYYMNHINIKGVVRV